MNRGAFDPEQERRWQQQIRECLIRECLARPDRWRPILKRWRERQRPGIEDLLRDIRQAWDRIGETKP